MSFLSRRRVRRRLRSTNARLNRFLPFRRRHRRRRRIRRIRVSLKRDAFAFLLLHRRRGVLDVVDHLPEQKSLRRRHDAVLRAIRTAVRDERQSVVLHARDPGAVKHGLEHLTRVAQRDLAPRLDRVVRHAQGFVVVAHAVDLAVLLRRGRFRGRPLRRGAAARPRGPRRGRGGLLRRPRRHRGSSDATPRAFGSRRSRE